MNKINLNRSIRDENRLKYFSGFGYVSIRVDIRGTGNSQGFRFHIFTYFHCLFFSSGLFDDEYSEQELSDGLKILQWIENQKWSNGKVILKLI